jgi:allantoate deiminase
MANVTRIQKDIETLRQITAPCEEGTTRLSYTPAFRAGADYLTEEMKKAGLTVREDGVGNLYGRLPGSDPSAPPIISGSHLDTVRCSGAFDGQAGVVCALEAARMLHESGTPLASTFEVLATVMEDGARFPGLGGSRFIAGRFTESDLETLTDDDGIRLIDAMKEYGLSGDLTGTCRRQEKAKAFLELHMEQGLKLEKSGTQIGIVEKIYGNQWIRVTAHGAVSHPSTPLDVRKDAALASYWLISEIAAVVASDYRGRATVTNGQMNLHPGVTNAIPSRTIFSLDFRSGSQTCLDELKDLTFQLARKIGKEYRVTFEVEPIMNIPPVPNTPAIVSILAESAKKLGISSLFLDSGAGHDAMILHDMWKTGMIFVPSRDGLTHCPQEWTDYENLAAGADILYEAARRIDREIEA